MNMDLEVETGISRDPNLEKIGFLGSLVDPNLECIDFLGSREIPISEKLASLDLWLIPILSELEKKFRPQVQSRPKKFWTPGPGPNLEEISNFLVSIDRCLE